MLPPAPPGDGSDRLSALPHDIRFEILSYLMLPSIKKDIYRFEDIAGNSLNKLALT